MAALAVQYVVDAGTEPALAAATVSDTASIGTGHDTYVHYKNTDANVKTLTIASHYINDNGDVSPAHVVTLAATTGSAKIPLRKSYDDGTGSATIVITGTGLATGVTSALVRVN